MNSFEGLGMKTNKNDFTIETIDSNKFNISIINAFY